MSAEDTPDLFNKDVQQTTWVGYARDLAAPLFVRLTILPTAELQASLDLPGVLRFRIPLVASPLAGGRERFVANIDGVGQLAFVYEPDAPVINGDLRRSGHHTRFPLRQCPPFNLNLYQPLIGTYKRDDGQHLLLGVRGDAPNQLPFYSEADSIVPLYPLPGGRYLSECCELLTPRQTHGGGLELRWRKPDGRLTTARRTAVYEEETVSFANVGTMLAGALLRPYSPSPVPAVVLMHGSSPGEREFYRVYADRFVRAGIAALIYDKRGTGASTGSADSTLEDRAGDAAAALRFLRARRDIDTDSVGLWAFSNGTWSAPMVAARIDGVAFMVVVGAAGVSGAEAETYRKLRELREWGVSEPVLREVGRAWDLIYGVVARGAWEAESDEAFDNLLAGLRADQRLRAIPLAAYAVANPWLTPVPPPITAAELRAKYNRVVPDLAYDPIADYERLRCPVLFMVGSDDANVPPDGARRVGAALDHSGHRDHTIHLVPGAGHALERTYEYIAGMSAAEASHELHAWQFVPGCLGLMVNWMLARCQDGRRAHLPL